MPSAARPFSWRVLGALAARGVRFAALTLHCGVASLEEPERPGIERYAVSPATADAVNAARREGRRVIAVGTTVVRALESAARDGMVVASSGWTELVIDGTRPLHVVDALLTGFHGPTATHQAMLRAVADAALLEEAYDIAAEHSYYGHEFGDSHLIL
jgi:S-adenosylmethionine:tRNA ribosyltransferase-isomerase